MRRPDVFTLDYSHPLAQGLVRAFFPQCGSFVDLLYGPRTAHVNNPSVTRNGANFVSANSQFVLLNALPSFDYMTVSAEISSRSVPASGKDQQIICADRAPSMSARVFQFRRYGSNNNLEFIVFNSSSLAIATGSTPMALGASYRVSGRYDGSSIETYVGGVKDGTAVLSGPVRQAHASAWTLIGAYQDETTPLYTSHYDGQIGHILIHNRALSPSEIALLADSTDPMLGGLIVEERPVLYFDMGGSTEDALTATDLVVGSPVLGTPALDQAHALTATGITTSAPALGSPALGQVHGLAATALTVSAPVLGTPAVGQAHSLTASALVVGSPVLGTPTLTENAPDVDALTANDLVVSSPVLGTPAIGQIHVLGSDGLVTGAPVLGLPSITQIHALEALGLTVGVPALGTPALNGSDIVLISADEVGRATALQARNYRATLAARNYAARL